MNIIYDFSNRDGNIKRSYIIQNIEKKIKLHFKIEDVFFIDIILR